jgi:hypothetical protein
MWIEVNKNIIVGSHSEQPSKSNYKLFEVDTDDIHIIGRSYTKAKGIFDTPVTDVQAAISASDEAKSYLKSTDYIVTKITEMSVLGKSEDVNALIEKYSDILEKRATARTLIV